MAAIYGHGESQSMNFTTDDVFHLSLEFRTGPAVSPNGRLDIDVHKVLDVDRFDDEGGTVVSWGTPAIGEKIVSANEIARLVRQHGIETTVKKFDCSFLIIIHDRSADRLTILTDRFGSLPFFYGTESGRFVASSSFKRLFDRRGGVASAGFDPWAVAEFLYFRRVFNTRTYDRDISFLAGASILTIEGAGSIDHRRYWRPNADKSNLGRVDLAERLAEGLKASMRTYMSDERRFGLLLSGGLDARALLAAAPHPPVCFTTTPKPNNEFAVAQALAAIRSAEHVYIPRPEQLLNNALSPSVALSGGMTVFHEVQFLGYGSQILDRADTLFMGLALDIMFCGHYLPKSLVSFAGRSGWHFRLQELPADLPRTFVDTISYRLKTSDPMRVIRADRREEMRARLIETVRTTMDEGREHGLKGYDLWEYVHLHDLARHYSFLMAQSVRTFAACRIPALSNALYDLCWEMRAEDKANWSVYQKAIGLLNPELLAVRNANTNIRASMPLWQQSIVKFSRAAGQKIGIASGTSPSWWDRSWPEPRQAIDANPLIQAALADLPGSPALASADLFDRDGISSVIDEHASGARDNTVLLCELLTIDRALKPFDE